jgi:hypothetical protein
MNEPPFPLIWPGRMYGVRRDCAEHDVGRTRLTHCVPTPKKRMHISFTRREVFKAGCPLDLYLCKPREFADNEK